MLALGIIGAIVLAILFRSVKIIGQAEVIVVERLGRFHRVARSGLNLLIPFIERPRHLDVRYSETDVSGLRRITSGSTPRIDLREQVLNFPSQPVITKDNVTIDIDAVLYYRIADPQKAVLEVSDYFYAIALSSQTALREAIGRAELAALITEREHIGAELRRILDEKTNPWGITVHSVEIRDVKIPQELEDAMSRQAQAERERQARILLGTAEPEIAARFVAAGAEYENRPVALHLRAMNMLYEAIKEKGSMVIVPSSAGETMGLGGLSGLTALGGGAVTPRE